MSYRFEIEAGKSKRFPVGGKYCDGDIIVTAVGGSDEPVPDEPVVPEFSEGLEIRLWESDDHATLVGIGTCTDDIIVIPEEYQGVPVINIYGLESIGSFKQIIMPDTLKYIDGGVNYCPNLERVEFGAGLEYINYWCFNGNSKCKEYDFTRCTRVPTLYFNDDFGDYSFEGMPSDCKMIVPDDLFDEWKSATNWALYADYIVVEGQENAQEKTIEITKNGSYEVIPDEGKLLRKVTANVEVEKRFKTYYVNIPTAVAMQFVTVVSGDPDVAAHYADDEAMVTVRKMSNNDTIGTALIAQGNHSFGTAYGAYINRKNDGTHGYYFVEPPLTTDKTDGSEPFVKCTTDGNIVVWAHRLQNNFGGADYIITFSW